MLVRFWVFGRHYGYMQQIAYTTVDARATWMNQARSVCITATLLFVGGFGVTAPKLCRQYVMTT